MSIDIALVGNEKTGNLIIHRADCLLVRMLASQGHPVVTLIGCESIPEGYPRHECMDEAP